MSGVTFTKLFASITESTVWCEPDATRITWIAMLAMADSQGRVWASIPGLANRARVTIEQAELAIETFLAPDPYSRTPDNEGRRIERIDGGWRLLNYDKYRSLRDNEAAKEAKRRYINDRRAKERAEKVDSKISTVERSRTLSNQEEEEEEGECFISSSLRSEEKVTAVAADPDAAPKVNGKKLPACPHQKVIDAYHELLPNCPPIVSWNETRQSLLRNLWRDKAGKLKWQTEEEGLTWFRKYFAFVAESEFLTGKAEGRNGAKPFIANLEWIIRPKNMTNIVEGKYHA